MKGRLDGKTILVTGAAGGIGQGLVRSFLKHGAFVAFCDRSGAEEFAAQLKGEGDFSLASVDVTKEHEIRQWIDGVAKARGGAIDGLVNNAAKFVFGTVEEASSEQWDEALTTNVRGYALMAKHVIPHMRKRGGSIVHMSSQSAFISQPKFCPYNTTKSAIEGLSRCIAHDYGEFSIRSNTVCPGTIETPVTGKHAASLGLSLDEFKKETCKELFIKRLGTPEDVANCCVFLLSDESTYVTGTHLMVDGGNTAH